MTKRSSKPARGRGAGASASERRQPPVGSLLRGLLLIELMSKNARPSGIAQLARDGGFSKGSVHALLQTLRSAGWVRQTEDGAYECTLKVWEIGTRLMERNDLRELARPHLRALWRETQETVHLSILDGTDALYIDKIDSPQRVLASFHVGDRLPAASVAAGKAMLAFEDGGKIAPAGAIEESLRKALRDVKRTGLAVNRVDFDFAINGLAAPIFNSLGAVSAAIGVSCPSERMGPEELKHWGPLVKQAAARVSADLGFSGAHEARK